MITLREKKGEGRLLHILMGRARTGKSERVLQRIAALGDSSQQILLVPEHASHVAEMDLCRVCGDTASRHAEALTFKLLASRVLSICGGSADVTLDSGGKLLTLQRTLTELAPRGDDVLSTIRWYGGDSYSIRYDTDSYYYYFTAGIDYEFAHDFYLQENALRKKNQISYTENGILYTQYDYIGAMSGEYMRLLRWDYQANGLNYSVLQTLSEVNETDIQTSGRSGYENFTIVIDDGDMLFLVNSGTGDVIKSVNVDEAFITAFIPQAMTFSE